jgi:hypothetical protein
MKHLTKTIVRIVLITGIAAVLAGCGTSVSVTNAAATTSSTTTSANLFTQWESKTLASDMAFQQGIDAAINGKNYLICNVIYGDSTNQENKYVTISILDISRADIPAEISSLQTGQDDEPYVWNLKLYGSILYVLTTDHLWIIDVSDPNQPKNVGQMPFEDATNIEESGKYAFIMSVTQTNEQSISTFDLSNPLQPLKIGQIVVPNIAFVNMVASDNILIALASRGLYIYDISTPNSLSQIGYLANTFAIPTLIAPEFIPPDYFDVALQGNVIYITAGINRLLVVDISVPSSPKIVNDFKTGEQGTEIIISGKTAYMFSYNGAIAFTERVYALLTSIAISDSTNPKELNSVSLPAPFRASVPESYGGMTKANNHLYFFDNRYPIIQIIDLSKSPWN